MADYPYFPFYVEDFAMGTAGMSPAAVGIYIRCLCHQWSHGFVPTDVRTVARLAGALPDEVEEAWPSIVTKFVETTPGRLQNARLEAERAKVLNTSKVRSGAGKAGAAARWNHGKSMANALPPPIAKALASVVPNAKAEPLAKAMPTQRQTDSKGNGKTIARAFGSDSDSSQGSSSNDQETSSPPNPPTPLQASQPSGRTWGGVGELLREAGISRVTEAIEAAQSRNLSLDEANDLIDQWQAHAGAWGAGALFDRLVGRSAAWPPAAPEFERKRQREQSQASHATNVANRQANEARRQAERNRYAALHAKHASEVDAWDGSRILAALEGDPMLVGMYQRSGLCRLVRERLYESLEQPVTA